MGWALGANNASNVIGPAVTSRMLRFGPAAFMASLFVLIGAMLQGRSGIDTLSSLTEMTLHQAVLVSVSAAITMTLMTIWRLPVSTSQAVVGAILGVGVLNRHVDTATLSKVVTCWVGTPIGGALMAMVLYRVLAALHNRFQPNLLESDSLVRIGLAAAGAYGAFALGANNVANVTAVFVRAGHLSVSAATLIGGLSIGLGILTFSKGVMETVGSRLVRLDPFSALVVLLATGFTIHFYTFIGVPISTSHAVIGAVLGIGLHKGIRTVSSRTLVSILSGWIFTPFVAGALVLALVKLLGES